MTRIIFIVLVLFSQQCMAGIYKWTDKNGDVHFGDSPPGNKKIEKVNVHVNSYKHVTYKHTDTYKAQNENKGQTDNKVIMFGTSWCQYCEKAREYFNAHNISYTDYDIEKDSHARQMYNQLGVSGVPVILVGKMELQGFSVAAFEKIYKRQ